ncbi:hypothetical protein BSLA_02r4394 [Burkholderia stabilis]|nr:hypothetical protein BSLA_02r4394 [Burkholderia stabilis]
MAAGWIRQRQAAGGPNLPARCCRAPRADQVAVLSRRRFEITGC